MRWLLGALLLEVCLATAHATIGVSIQVNTPDKAVSAQFAAPSQLAALVTGPVKQKAAAASAFINRRMLQLQSAAGRKVNLDAMEVLAPAPVSRGAAIEVPRQRGRTPPQQQQQQPKFEINPQEDKSRTPATRTVVKPRTPAAAATPAADATPARGHAHRERPSATGAAVLAKPTAEEPARDARTAAARSSKDTPAAAPATRTAPAAANAATTPAKNSREQPAKAPQATFVRSFVTPTPVATAAVADPATAAAEEPAAEAPAPIQKLAPAEVISAEDSTQEPDTQAPAVHSAAADSAPVSIAAVSAAALPADAPAVTAEPAAGSIVTAAAWESCGGAGNTCSQAVIDAGNCKDEAWKGYRCAAGFACVREHQWFWNCRPSSRH